MRAFAKTLIEMLGGDGPIVVYSAFEKTAIRQLAARYPDLADPLEAVESRLVDILPMIRRHYYHPAMGGSFSIKAILPTVAPHLSYSDLDDVRDGGAAQAAFVECIDRTTPSSDKARLVAALRADCERDTLAMVELVRGLSKGKTPVG